MRVVLQRVSAASVQVEGRAIASIEHGVLALVGIRRGDSEEDADWIARKIAEVRIFDDADGKLNLSLMDVAGQALMVPNFTLYGDARKGRRPSYTAAAPPEEGRTVFDQCCALLERRGLKVLRGEFGASMAVSLINDGPVTLLLDSDLRSCGG